MHDDLISRQAAIDDLNYGAELLKRVLDDTDIVGVERAKCEWGLGLIESYISDMEELPSADAVPVVHGHLVHGHWIDKFAGEYRCSSCREKVCIDDEVEFPNGIRYEYCPWCGAKMDEVTE